MSSKEEQQQLRDRILAQSLVPGCRSAFVIGYGAPQVTVYSQQVRALNLIWALSPSLKGKSIVIVGGGIAGVTAAAAAKLHGAKVTLLEQNDELLHFQRGCYTRFLHPRIFEWPHSNAQRAGAGLPILDWSVGTASDVANRILADYHRIRLHAGPGIKEVTNVRGAHINEDGKTILWNGGKPVRPAAIILALGFGIERTVAGMPRRSYWRVDSLTQTQLDSLDAMYVVLVAGTGDGGIIDVLRASLKEFDHGGFLDECVLRLQKKPLLVEVESIEREMEHRMGRLRGEGKSRIEIDSQVSEWLHWRYSRMSGLDAIVGLLNVARSTTRVIWAGRPKYPCSPFCLALNRILGWKTWMKGQSTGRVDYVQADLQGVRLLDQESASGYRYEVKMSSADREPWFAHAHQVVVRCGNHSALERSFPHIHKALGKHTVGIEGDMEPTIRDSYTELYEGVRPPYKPWREDIRIHAAPEYKGAVAWRIRLWLKSERALRHVAWIDYDLHPEYRAVQRRAVWTNDTKRHGQQFRHWINTRDDHWIRMRGSDGVEFGDWLSNALANTEVDCNGNALDDPTLRDRCIDDLRSATGHVEGYLKQPWCGYIDPPSPSDADTKDNGREPKQSAAGARRPLRGNRSGNGATRGKNSTSPHRTHGERGRGAG
jgi:hypothetical protein